MSYQVLARKWRPGNFHEMVGQNHVLQALINGLDSDRLHHAYLFTGTRGVGKTSVARILAKCLNCEQGVSSKPCGECSACLEIAEGRFVDLIEVDAASRTKVEDTRELLENVQYTPSRGRFKVYLIDEVHMLSSHSFNALLKTLEEPPPHVKFLLATTDPQRLPATILSRCLQFSLKNLAPDLVQQHLAYILGQENITFEDNALSQLARAAAGSMRDALSLTDQAIAFGAGSLSQSVVQQMLGSIDRQALLALLQALIDGDASSLFDQIDALAAHGTDLEALLREMQTLLHAIAVTQLVPQQQTVLDLPPEQLQAFARALTSDQVQLYYQIALTGLRDFAHAPDARCALEMTLLRMLAFVPAARAQTTPAITPSSDVVASDEQKKKPEPVVKPVVEREDVGAGRTASSPETVLSEAVSPLAAPNSNVTNAYDDYPELGNNKVIALDIVDAVPASQQAASPQVPTPENNRPRVEIGLKAQALPEDLSIDNVQPAHWTALFEQLALSGMARNVASNCVLAQRDGRHLHLLLDEQRCKIFKSAHSKQIESALVDYFATEIRVDIVPGQCDEETPFLYAQRQQAEQLQIASDAIYNDETVKAVLVHFDAVINAASITPRKVEKTT